ncbi:MAG: DUF1292 domain-containing protein, partial [Peptococcaceae bacterium]
MKEPEETITLIDEEGVEHDFTLVDIIEVDGFEYAILLPVNDEEEDEAIVLRFTQDEEGNDLLIDIEDDEEWEKV